MEIQVLGTFEARGNGASVTPTACKPRQMLALLGLRAGDVVTTSALLEEIWGTTPPPSATMTLQTYVCQLRKRIEAAGHPDAKEVLVTTYGGYLLNAETVTVDAAAFDRLASAGRRALDAGQPEHASDLLRSALDVWRGPALAGVNVGPQLAVDVARLEESRLCVLETLLDADLRLGRHRALLGQLASLTEQYPMHETFCAQRMIALHRSGQRGLALEAYRALHDNLIEKLGLGPSERLRRLRRTILRVPGGGPSRKQEEALRR